MKVQVKGYKKFHGHDGQGFEASVWVDGKRTAIVSYDGWGGEFMYSVLDRERYDELETRVRALPPQKYTMPHHDENDNETGVTEHEMDMDMDVWIDDLIEHAAHAKSRKVVTKGPNGEFYTWNGSGFKKANYDAIQARMDERGEGHMVVNGTTAEATI